MKKTRSTTEALSLLESRRAWLVSLARRVAVELCKRDGSSNSHAVLVEMRSRGMLDGYDGKHHWAGAIFAAPEIFVTTGELHKYSDRKGDRNVHERTIMVWKLARPDVTLDDVPLPCRPHEPPPRPTLSNPRCPQLGLFAPRNDFMPKDPSK